MDVSRNISENNPNHMAAFKPRKRDCVKVKLPALGKSSITATAMSAPTSKYGLRRPRRFQVLSEYLPTIGCTIIPINGGRIQKKLSVWGSAPKVAKIREIFALCSAYAIYTPKKPKLRLNNCAKDKFRFCMVFYFIVFNIRMRTLARIYGQNSATKVLLFFKSCKY